MRLDDADNERESGFLLIADMEASTRSKFVLGEEGAFAALREHNRLIMEHCRKAQPLAGLVLNSLGDAVVAKFPCGNDDASRRAALHSCLSAARAIVADFEALSPIVGRDAQDHETVFPLRTKLTLQHYDAFRYGRREERSGLAEELVGPDIDAAFRISEISWRLQVLVTERFALELLRQAGSDLDPRALLRRAHAEREQAATRPEPMTGISVPLCLRMPDSELALWITDAREIARLRGIPDNQRVYLLGFDPPEALIRRGQRARLMIKVRQVHHAVILASVSLPPGRNDDYIDFVVATLGDSSRGRRLASELTLCAAAKIYGEFDFFFRVSCIDDLSLRHFFDTIHDERFGVRSVEVRATVADRFRVNPDYERILAHFHGRGFDLVLTWFPRDADKDLFEHFLAYMDEGNGGTLRPVEILEVGEVIHHKPVYGIFICESLAAYASFFADSGLNPTGCRSHIAQITRPGDARLRYSLMSGVYPVGSR